MRLSILTRTKEKGKKIFISSILLLQSNRNAHLRRQKKSNANSAFLNAYSLSANSKLSQEKSSHFWPANVTSACPNICLRQGVLRLADSHDSFLS